MYPTRVEKFDLILYFYKNLRCSLILNKIINFLSNKRLYKIN